MQDSTPADLDLERADQGPGSILRLAGALLVLAVLATLLIAATHLASPGCGGG
jgi:hypothetical protein